MRGGGLEKGLEQPPAAPPPPRLHRPQAFCIDMGLIPHTAPSPSGHSSAPEASRKWRPSRLSPGPRKGPSPLR